MGITLENIRFSYGAQTILKDLSCTFKETGFHSILGPNGSGKTTLLDIVSGFLRPDQGGVFLDDTPITRIPKKQLARNISLVSQNFSVNFPYTVQEIILMGRHPYIDRFSHPTKEDYQIADTIMRRTGVDHLKNRKITELSGGEKQRCVFARALCQDTPILLLDEAFSNMDISHTLHLLAILKQEVHQKGKTIIAVLHDLNLASEWSDSMLFLKKGSILAQGNTTDVFTQETIQAVFNVNTKVEYNEYVQAKQAYFKAS